MNRLFWIEVQKCWCITLSIKDKRKIHKKALDIVKGIAISKTPNRYSKNPLDDGDDFEDDDE